MPVAWGGSAAEDEEILARDYAVSRTGTYSLRIVRPGDKLEGPYWTTCRYGQPTGTRLPHVKPGERWRFSAWVRAEGPAVRSRVALSFLDERRSYVRSEGAASTGAHDWKEVAVTATAPPGAARLTLELESSGPEGTSWFDDFKLENLEEPK